jgi:hypothetical protein
MRRTYGYRGIPAKENEMKTLLVIVALVATLTTPALAQQAQRGGPNAVYSGDQYLGADPDPFIQLELRRGQNWRNGGY